jgi:hypothetical protein
MHRTFSPSPDPPWQSRRAIILRLAALFIGRPRRDDMRRYWMIANYLVAIALAMIGWLWLIAWIARQLV